MALTEILWERWELIDVLTRVLAARDAEAKLKVEVLQQLFTEVVPLDHPEVIDGDVSYCEFNTKNTETRQGRYSVDRFSSSVFISLHSSSLGFAFNNILFISNNCSAFHSSMYYVNRIHYL